ncbi:MAG: proline iminopeptidase [Hyphobacterium sp.]|nr:MAG: proline iminopeptidase [Hyphobacterium sp.]
MVERVIGNDEVGSSILPCGTIIMTLFDEIAPFQTGRHKTGDGHTLYWERCGKKGGIPILFLHGGPGSGCTPQHRRYFDPKVFDAVLFDQRGCGRSTPNFLLHNNTTEHQVADIDALRKKLGIHRWIVMGPSWGSTLALAYSQAHPDSVSGLLVEGVFLGADKELAWWHSSPGAPNLFPDAYADLMSDDTPPDPSQIDVFFESMRDRMLAEIENGMPELNHIDSADPDVEDLRRSLLYRWTEYEDRISWLNASSESVRDGLQARGAQFVACHSLIEAHYFANRCFLRPNEILLSAETLSPIPMEIVQSRYDIVCPADAAYRLANACPHAQLTIVDRNGHAMTEAVYPAIAAALNRLAASAVIA